MARLERLRVYPVKGLDGVDLETADILEGGTVAHDREFALFDGDGDVFNGKRTDRIHDLDADFDLEAREVALETPDGERQRFDLETDREAAADWLSEFFGIELSLKRDRSLGFVDRREMGPSVISTATLRTVADWFDRMTVEGARRRLRANVEIDGVEPFWEDRFVGADAPAFEVGGVRFDGVTPCGRCVVPERDPNTGEPTPAFREQFVRRREETFPDWADADAFDHYYSLMIIARVPESDRGKPLHVNDPIEIVDGDQ
ncbi:MOSC N-terminal beta barrel domain-containing protein [Natrinema zhouii]|uniref:MOSC N-terminal beta barrel domain-containing protein n=1 Tax=Natrinema zhouii TaxID=1710539 RepID=A0A7D6CQC1_9EURY|nr:MOSC N-terminal beta barrel domain-containing protein [Natrinema zhouii]QLK26536.1 MOSC N-terminal beta barrel domain-containing protein [Natrinema zhouii]